MTLRLVDRRFPVDPGGLLPPVTDDNRFFHEALARGELAFQCCSDCARLRFPIAPVCPYCGGTGWREAAWRLRHGFQLGPLPQVLSARIRRSHALCRPHGSARARPPPHRPPPPSRRRHPLRRPSPHRARTLESRSLRPRLRARIAREDTELARRRSRPIFSRRPAAAENGTRNRTGSFSSCPVGRVSFARLTERSRDVYTSLPLGKVRSAEQAPYSQIVPVDE